MPPRPLSLRIDVPVCGFRPFTARDYQETYPAPPPATVFGMLLALIGREPADAGRFQGVRMALAIPAAAGRHPVSTVLRKMHRGDDKPSGAPRFRPEYQELMFDFAFWCTLADTQQQSEPLTPLIERALRAPATIDRHGALSLGESAFLVDSIREEPAPSRCLVLRPEPQGSYALPVWVDHADRTRTRLQRFSLVEDTMTEHDAVTLGPA